MKVKVKVKVSGVWCGVLSITVFCIVVVNVSMHCYSVLFVV